MLIFLEGNECVYKSTVAEKLSKRFGCAVKKGSSFEMSKCSNEELYQKFATMIFDTNVIYDRYILSNRVYTNIYEGFTRLTDGQFYELLNFTNKRGKIVYLYAQDEVVKERLRLRGDEYVDESKISTIAREYNNVLREVHVPILKVDTSYRTSDEVVEEICKQLGLNSRGEVEGIL